jgi:WD40 repeat protein
MPASDRVPVTVSDVAEVELPSSAETFEYDRFVTLRGHSKGIWGMTQLADGRICSAGADNDVRIWNLDMKTCDLVLRGHNKSVG